MIDYDQVQEWLRELVLDVKAIESNEQARPAWSFEITVTGDRTMHVVCTSDEKWLELGRLVQVADRHKVAFKELDKDLLRTFYYELIRGLLQSSVQYQVSRSEDSGILESFVVTDRIWHEDLDPGAIHASLMRVMNASLFATVMVRHFSGEGV